MDQPNIPWIYVAMVFIAFAHWIFTQFRAAAEKREEMRRRRSGEWEDDEDDFIVFEEAESVRPVERNLPPPLRDEAGDRREAGPAERRKPSPGQVSPPPIPTVDRMRRELDAKRKAAQALPSVPKHSPILGGSAEKAKRRGSGLGALLRDRNQVRGAIILKEILDSPKGLR